VVRIRNMRRSVQPGPSTVATTAEDGTGKDNMLSDAPASFDGLRAEVETLMEVGEPLAAAERLIDASDLSEEHRAALWLLAWSLADPPEPLDPRRYGRPRSPSSAPLRPMLVPLDGDA
jgi:hypothetical protein